MVLLCGSESRAAIVVACDLQESDGTTATDSSGNSNNLTLSGGLTFTTDTTDGPGGTLTSALRLDGVGDYLGRAKPAQIAADSPTWSALFFFRIPSTPGSNAYLLSLRADTGTGGADNQDIFVTTGMVPTVDLEIVTVAGSITLATDTWYQLAVAFEGSTDYQLWIDGVSEATSSHARATNSLDDLRFGATASSTPAGFAQMDIAGIEIHDVAITSTEIAAHANKLSEPSGSVQAPIRSPFIINSPLPIIKAQ